MCRRVLFVAILAAVAVASLPADANAKPESWYTYWGIGYANGQYPSALQDALDYVEDQPGITHVSIALDLLGFYWPLGNRNTIVGGILNGAGDRYAADDTWMQLNSYLVGPSVVHTFGPEPGDGFFVRADVGLAWLSVSAEDESSESSDFGVGALAGLGYGFAVSEGTRLLLNLNYTLRHVEDEDYGMLGLTLGGLF